MVVGFVMVRIGIEDGRSWVWPFLLLARIFSFFVFVKINNLKN
jgi:hypothetical protein